MELTAPIITIAEEVKDLIDAMTLSVAVTPERVYVRDERMQTIGNNVCVWVQPSEFETENISRAKTKDTYIVDVGIFKKCLTDAEVDEMINLANEIRTGFERHEYASEARTLTATWETIFSQEYLIEKNIFATVITVTIVDLIG